MAGGDLSGVGALNWATGAPFFGGSERRTGARIDSRATRSARREIAQPARDAPGGRRGLASIRRRLDASIERLVAFVVARLRDARKLWRTLWRI